MKITGVFIPCDDTVRTSLVTFDNADFTTQENLIGATMGLGFIRINENDDARIIIDDAGRLKGKPVNYRCAGMYPGPICGDVILVGWDNNIGEDELEMTDAPMFYQTISGAI